MSWPRSFIDEVRRSADGVQIVGEVVALKKRGARWVGLCPFHGEKTPSFTINDEGLWYCFGCGEGGDVFKFVQQYEGVGFADAVRSIAERAGVPVPEPTRGRRAPQQEPRVRRERLLAALAAAQEFYVGQLAGAAGVAAREYLQGRGLGTETIARFGLGYAPEGWETTQQALRKRGFDDLELEAAGLVKQRSGGSGVYDLLRDRIVFPIRDLRGRPLAFGGRILAQGEPKYLNSPETAAFHKSRTLYGLGEAREAMREAGFALLVEGYLDLLACAQHGFANVVAPLGTSFTAEHAKALSSHVRKAVIGFDGDAAGNAAAERTVGIFLAAGFQVSVLCLPAGQDPDSFLVAEGAAGLARALRGSLPALAFLVERASEREDVRSPRGKAQALAGLLGFVLEVQDRVERAEWIGRIAEALQIGEHLVARSFSELKRRRRQHPTPPGGPGPSLEAGTAGLDEVPLAERDLLRAVLAQPGWLPRLQKICGPDAIRDARVACLLQAVATANAGGAGKDPIPADRLLEHCDIDGADQLLSRLTLESDEAPDWEYTRGCAAGIRRDALLRELKLVQKAIEEALRNGDQDVAELQQRKLALAQEVRAG